jgi:hypothetical protein
MRVKSEFILTLLSRITLKKKMFLSFAAAGLGVG